MPFNSATFSGHPKTKSILEVVPCTILVLFHQELKERLKEYGMDLVQEDGLIVRRREFDPEMSWVTIRVGIPDEVWGPERPDKRWNPETRSFTMVSLACDEEESSEVSENSHAGQRGLKDCCKAHS